ncbi:MAG: hypothetical protein J0H98_08220 [Solirubrobacterales bacterium]|nr:hypothetical protein [Solirubrobacterales bacterium]
MKRLILIGALILLGTPGAASANVAWFDRAEANQDWTTGSFSGSITWDSCTPKACEWQPVLLAIPASGVDCEPALLYGSTNRAIVWVGPTRYEPGTFTFSVEDASIMRGVHGQKACMVVTYKSEARDIFCEFDNPPSSCPTIVEETAGALGSRVMTEAAPALTRAKAARIARSKIAAKYGRVWRQGSRRRITCRPQSNGFRCSARWRFKHKYHRAVVLVRK